MKFTPRDGLKARGYPWSNKHLLELERESKFPRRVRLADKTVAWVTEELDQYDSERIAERDHPE